MTLVLRGLLKSIPVTLVLSACVAVAARLEALGVGGVLVTLAMIVVLVFVAAMVWAHFIPWFRREFLVSLCPIPVVVLFVVSYYSGFTGQEILHSFNLAYVAQICLVLLVPWVAGAALGSRIGRRKTP